MHFLLPYRAWDTKFLSFKSKTDKSLHGCRKLKDKKDFFFKVSLWKNEKK